MRNENEKSFAGKRKLTERMITNETYKIIISGIDKQKNYYLCYLNKQKQEYYEEALSHRNTEF